MFSVLSGVLQGCPLSGVLFNFAIDPLLYLFSTLIITPGFGKVLACADDIGASLVQLRHLVSCHNMFGVFQKVSGLTLKPRKCILILTSIEASPHNIDVVRTWLKENIPSWEGVRICSSAKCLGIFLGPSAGQMQWIAPLQKFQTRVAELAAFGAPPLIIREYNFRAVPTLGFVAQYVPPPQSIKRI